MRKLYLLLLFLMIIPMVHADSPIILTTGVQGKNYTLVLDCSNQNGTLISSSAVANITRLENPNQTIILLNAPMTRKTNANSVFNFTITNVNTTVLGTYDGTQLCCDQNQCGSARFEFQITPTGTMLSSGENGIIIIAIFSVFLLSILLFCIGLYNQNRITKVIFYAFSFVMVIAGFLITTQAVQNYVITNPGFELSYSRLMFALGLFGFILMIFLVLFAIFISIKLMRQKARFSE